MASLTAMIVTFFLADIPHLNYQQNIRECFDTIVNIRGGHAPGHHDLHIRFSKCQLALAHLEVQQGYFVYFSEQNTVMCPWPLNSYAKALWSVIITSVFWFNSACSIYVKILWWYSCPQLCLLSEFSRYEIWVYNNYIVLPSQMIHWFALYTLETYQLYSGSWLRHIYNILMGMVMAELSMLLLTWMLYVLDIYVCMYIPLTKLRK